MRLLKLSDVDAFVAVDLGNADSATGPVRWAKRILQGGAKDLARSQTYTYAALGMRLGGASAGISAPPPGRPAAVTAFVEQAAKLAADRVYFPDAAKGVDEGDLAPLRPLDPRNVDRLGAFASACDALTAASAADAAIGGLDGRRVAVEGFGAPGSADAGALAAEIAERGGIISCVSAGNGTLAAEGGRGRPGDGLDPAALKDAWNAHGYGAVAALAGDLGHDLAPAEAIWHHGAEVVFAGSKMGAANHHALERLVAAGGCGALIPSGRLALTAKALAVSRRNGITAVPDFVALAGGSLAAWSDPALGDAELRSQAADTVSALMADALASKDGTFLGGCYAAESFLSTWQDELPFGRPLAP